MRLKKRCGFQFVDARCLIFSLPFAILLARLTPYESNYTPAGMLLLLAGSAFVVLDLRGRGSFEQIVLLSGYFVRLALVALATNWPNIIPFRFGTSDSEKFYRVALEYYYHGDYATYYTNYPYLLNAIFKLFGAGQLIPLYLNVFCWYLCWIVLRRALHNCEKKQYSLIALFYCFMPANIMMTTELLRESIMMLFMALSLFCIQQWMKTGGIYLVYAFLLALPAIWLHPVSIAMWGTAAMVFLLWEPESRHWGLSRKKLLLLLASIVFLFIVLYFRLYALFDYFPNEITVHSLTWRPYDLTGRSNYLMDIEVTTWGQFALWTPVRCLYFWISPIIFDWNAWLDPAAVAFDVVPLMVLLAVTARKTSKNGERMHYVGWIALLLYTILYAWGVTNAGTAMRHRNMLTVLIILTYAMKCNDAKFCTCCDE